jgi:hypothetical protein
MKKKKSYSKVNDVIEVLSDESRYASYWDENDHDELEGLYNYFGGRPGNLYKNAVLPADYVFDPKNPPMAGCTSFHPPLQLAINDKAVEIYGSSCSNPIVADADIYISLDRSSPNYDWEHPWIETDKKHIRFIIVDGSIPEDNEQFKQCIDYTIKALDEGKKVHVGCIAGHGRTGLFLAALAQKTIGKKLDEDGISAIDYVRDTYCANAVENLRQVLFLTTLHGIALPTAEKDTMRQFEDTFFQEIGVDFQKVIQDAGFYATLPTIKAIDAKMYSITNRHMKNYTKNSPVNSTNKSSNYFHNTTENFHSGVKYPPINAPMQSNLPVESNGTVAMGIPPERFSRDTFATRLNPEKVAKLQAFKLRRQG